MSKSNGFYELTCALNAKTDLVALIEQQGIHLKKRGKLYWACCPFHSEKTPSFSVNSQTQRYHCFGCGEHGYGSHFLKKHSKMAGIEAIQYLADFTHTPLEDIAQLRYEIAQIEKTQQILKIAADFYENNLHDPACCDDVKQLAYEYLIETRNYTLADLKKCKIGLSGSKSSLIEFFKKQHPNYTDDDLIAAGVARVGKTGRFIDHFHNTRAIFPVFNSAGRVEMLSGRTIDAAEPKYLHTPHQKNEILYGINFLPKNFDKLIVVEGNFDVVRGVALKLPVIGTLGGKCSDQQLQRLLELSGYGDKPIYLCLDSDSAGKKAAFETVKLAFKYVQFSGGLIKVVELPSDDGKKVDFDSFLSEFGIEELNGLLDASIEATGFFKREFLSKNLVENFDSQSPEFKATLAKKLAAELKHLSDDDFKSDLIDFCLGKPKKQSDTEEPELLIPNCEDEHLFPIDALGMMGKLATEALARNVQCSPNMVAHAVLATMAISTCQFAKVLSYAPNSDSDAISLNAAFMTVADSSEGKGRVESALLRDLRLLDQQLRATYQKNNVDFKQKMKSYEIELTALLKAQLKEGGDQAIPLPPHPPRNQTFIFESPTIQAIQKGFERGSSFVLIATDEGMQFLAGWANQDGRQNATLATYNALIDRGSISRTTATDDFNYVNRAAILNLAIQPKLWDSWINKGDAQSLGFLARFLTVRPNSTQGYRNPGVQLTENEQQFLAAFRSHTKDLMSKALNTAAEREQLIESPKYFMGELIDQAILKCEPSALKLWIDFCREIEPEKAPHHPREKRCGIYHEIKDIIGKFDQFVGKIAGWLALWECDIEGLISKEFIPVISDDHMRRAIRIMRFYLAEAERIAKQPKVDQTTQNAAKLLDWMRNPVVNSGGQFRDFQESPVFSDDGEYRVFNIRDLMQHSPSRVPKAKLLELLRIIESHIGNGKIEQGNRRDSLVYLLPIQQ